MTRTLLYISTNIADLTVTFIYREITDLMQLGFEIDTVSMNKPVPERVSLEAKGLLESTLYLDQITELQKLNSIVKTAVSRPKSLFRCLRVFFSAQPMRSLRDYLRLGYHLMDACYLSSKYAGRKPDHIHSHFLTGPTSIAMFLAELLGVPFSFTSHGSLIWQDPVGLLTKLERCKFSVTISSYNRAFLLGTYGRRFAPKLHVVHCGIYTSAGSTRASAVRKQRPISILGVASLYECKGFHILIDAAKMLRDQGLEFSCTIVGEGDQRTRLEAMIQRYDLQHHVNLVGAQPHERIPEFLKAADIFALPCIITASGQRDGLPVSLMEAMYRGLPTVSTDIGGFSELIDSGTDGILVRQNDAAALTTAIADLAGTPELRHRLGMAATKKIEEEFNAARSAERLAALFKS